MKYIILLALLVPAWHVQTSPVQFVEAKQWPSQQLLWWEVEDGCNYLEGGEDAQR